MPSIDYDQLDLLSDQVYQNAIVKGFHEAGKNENDVQRLARYTANLHGEVSELWEAARRGTLDDPCDKDATVPFLGGTRQLTCAEEELADIVIRAMDTARALGIRIGECVKAKHEYNLGRPHMHGGKLA